MSESFDQPELHTADNVIAFDGLHRVRRVNGIALPLGTMSYADLMSVYVSSQERMAAAARDTDVVALYLDERFPNGPESA